MGLLGVQEEQGSRDRNGLAKVAAVGKEKYRRLDAEHAVVGEEEEAVRISPRRRPHGNDRSARTKNYVFACAVFASLNSVLLGYGTESHYLLVVFFP